LEGAKKEIETRINIRKGRREDTGREIGKKEKETIEDEERRTWERRRGIQEFLRKLRKSLWRRVEKYN
jgi:hypothetical protein